MNDGQTPRAVEAIDREAIDWIAVAGCGELPAGDVRRLQWESFDVAVYRVDDEFLATDNRCTHGNAMLSEGWLEEYEIECPLHQGRFDIRTGEPVHPPVCIALRTYPVRVRDGTIYVGLSR